MVMLAKGDKSGGSDMCVCMCPAGVFALCSCVHGAYNRCTHVLGRAFVRVQRRRSVEENRLCRCCVVVPRACETHLSELMYTRHYCIICMIV